MRVGVGLGEIMRAPTVGGKMVQDMLEAGFNYPFARKNSGDGNED